MFVEIEGLKNELFLGNVAFFVEGGKLENLEKHPWSKDKNQQQGLPPYNGESGIETWATLVGGEWSHHSTAPSLLLQSHHHLSLLLEIWAAL